MKFPPPDGSCSLAIVQLLTRVRLSNDHVICRMQSDFRVHFPNVCDRTFFRESAKRLIEECRHESDLDQNPINLVGRKVFNSDDKVFPPIL